MAPSQSRQQGSQQPSESTPLLAQDANNQSEHTHANGVVPELDGAASPAPQDQDSEPKRFRLKRWPSFLALGLLSLACVLILILGFVLPQAVQEYALQAMVIEPRNLSIDSITPKGVVARVRADFTIDAGRVKRKPIRDLGRLGTWIAGQAETSPTRVTVSLPGYHNSVLGMANIPAMKVNVRNQHTTAIDFLTEVQPGTQALLGHIADDWLAGEIKRLEVHGHADVAIRSGIISLGVQSISKSFVLQGDDVPTMPKYNISKLNFREMKAPEGPRGLAAEVGLEVANKYPFDFAIPPLGFAIMVPACVPTDPYLLLADATIGQVHVKPKQDLALNVTGYVRRLPKALVTACPGSTISPLDAILGDYMHGDATTVYIRGSDAPSVDTPQWLTDIISSITVPVALPGHTFGKLIRKFTMKDLRFSLPDSEAEPGTPEAQPKISGIIKALVGLPKEMNFGIDVQRIRASADVFYHGKMLGYLDVQDWQNATSKPSLNDTALGPGLEVEAELYRTPLTVTNDDLFSDVVQALLLRRSNITLTIKAKVDVELHTALGTFVVRQIPGEGVVPIKPIFRHDLSPALMPKIYDLRIAETTEESVTIDVMMNFSNPTSYAATVPYVDINILVNNTIMGHATAQNVSLFPGNNSGIAVRAVWEPSVSSGKNGSAISRELLSQYLSGYNTTLTLRTHNGTIPSQPALGHALSSLEINIPTPRLTTPKPPSSGDEPSPPGTDPPTDDGRAPIRFIKQATMHLISSTAQFELLSPLSSTTIFLTSLEANAFHEGHPVGKIDYEGLIAVPPGESTTPRLPVQWSLDSLGYKALRQALGGTLKLQAMANVGVRIGDYEVKIWYRGRAIGAKVRL